MPSFPRDKLVAGKTEGPRIPAWPPTPAPYARSGAILPISNKCEANKAEQHQRPGGGFGHRVGYIHRIVEVEGVCPEVVDGNVEPLGLYLSGDSPYPYVHIIRPRVIGGRYAETERARVR
jgi:hypothetical protein